MESENATGWMQRARRLLCTHPYSLVGAIVAAALLVPLLRHDQDWVSVYMPAAERLVSGADIFTVDFVYPPVNALLPLPFLGLPRLVAKLVWYAINLASFVVLILGAWKLGGGGRLEGGSTRSAFADCGSVFARHRPVHPASPGRMG